MTSFELGWLVGIMEGEGSFMLSTNGQAGPEISLTCSSTDKDVVEHVYALAGCGRINGPYTRPLSTKPIWRWRTRNRDDVVSLVEAMLPHLSERRSEQATRLLEWDAATSRRYARGTRATLEPSHVLA